MAMANRAGQRANVLNFPLMFPPPRIDGVVIPGGWMPWRQLRLGCHPEGIYDEIKALPGFNPRELAMDMTHEEKALEGCRHDEDEDGSTFTSGASGNGAMCWVTSCAAGPLI